MSHGRHATEGLPEEELEQLPAYLDDEADEAPAAAPPETWPDYASEIGRFTLRAGGLLDQTFEIEVAAGTASGRPIFTRGYVTITDLVTPDDPAALNAWFDDLEEGLARYGEDEPRAVPRAASGSSASTSRHTRTTSWAPGTTGSPSTPTRSGPGSVPPAPGIRCRGTSTAPYRIAGRDAQHAFSGEGTSSG